MDEISPDPWFVPNAFLYVVISHRIQSARFGSSENGSSQLAPCATTTTVNVPSPIKPHVKASHQPHTMGVTVETTQAGDGQTYPKPGDSVTMDYTGTLLDGTVRVLQARIFSYLPSVWSIWGEVPSGHSDFACGKHRASTPIATCMML